MVSPTEGADWIVTAAHFNLLQRFYFVVYSGPVILIFNKGQFITFYYNLWTEFSLHYLYV
jgi:hypothetical protein